MYWGRNHSIISRMNTVNQFFGSIYKWMAAGVLVSALFSWLTMNTQLSVVLQNPGVFYALAGIELALLFFIQFMINKLSYKVSFVLYFVYAALTGITISGLLVHFLSTKPMTVVVIFAAAVILFITLAIIGYRMKYNMSGWGTFLFSAVWGILIVSLLNGFVFKSGPLDIIVSSVAMIVFSALTVYDSQYYKNLFPKLQTEEEKSKASTLGALHMYVNLLVMFQSLLNLTGYFGGE